MQPTYQAPNAPAVWIPPSPVSGIPVKGPLVPPGPGQVLIRYDIAEPETGCCKCDTLTTGGIIALVVLVLIFWPLAWLPCIMSSCHTQVQRPVYGNPPAPMMPAMPTGYPVQGMNPDATKAV
jgi:hypothetical protein